MNSRFALAAALVCGLAAAQSFRVEDFDIGGLPAKPQTATERELSRRISGHRSGDVDGAIQIQRSLAAYYREKGDEERMRAAEQRAEAATGSRMQAPGRRGRGVRGETGFPLYGTVPPRRAPDQGDPPLQPAAPVENPAGAAVDIPIYAPATPPAETEAGATPRTDLKVPETAPAPSQEAVTGPPPAEQPAGLSGRFWMLRGRMLHTWAFHPDGTFEHTWSPRENATSANLEAGTYRIAGPYMMLIVLRQLADGREAMAPAGAPGRQTRRLRFEMLGTRADDGIMLDGMMLKPK